MQPSKKTMPGVKNPLLHQALTIGVTFFFKEPEDKMVTQVLREQNM